jgi:hypothetical protein
MGNGRQHIDAATVSARDRRRRQPTRGRDARTGTNAADEPAKIAELEAQGAIGDAGLERLGAPAIA